MGWHEDSLVGKAKATCARKAPDELQGRSVVTGRKWGKLFSLPHSYKEGPSSLDSCSLPLQGVKGSWKGETEAAESTTTTTLGLKHLLSVLWKISSTPPCRMQELVPAGSYETFLKAHFFTHSTYPLLQIMFLVMVCKNCPFLLTSCHVAAICWLFPH